MKRSASVIWVGNLKVGKGLVTSESGTLSQSQYFATTRVWPSETGLGIIDKDGGRTPTTTFSLEIRALSLELTLLSQLDAKTGDFSA
jgi:hypothetical protein